MSKQYENDIAKQIHRETPSRVRAYRCGYSGNNAMPQPDVLVTDVMENHALEVKGPIQSGIVYIEEDDLEQLVECGNAKTTVYLVVKFSRREPVIVRYFDELTGQQQSAVSGDYDDMSIAEKFSWLAPDSMNPHVTDSGNLVLEKPSTDEWPSAQAGSDDVDAIVTGLGIATPDSVVIE